VLDLPAPGSHGIIGDRAYCTRAMDVAALGRAVCEGLIAGGVLPVIKHIPGHGRARADSHLELPVVDTPLDELAATDFAPFAALHDMPAAMTAHIVYSAIDRQEPATSSLAVLQDVVRRAIGFDGLLMSDDLGMKALTGPFAERARKAIGAGCDVALHCSGNLGELREVAAGAGALDSAGRFRLARCHALLGAEQTFDVAEAEALLAEAMAMA
jgi:beta-N-acetylhexosaminidase